MKNELKKFIKENFEWNGGWYPKEEARNKIRPLLLELFNSAINEVAKNHNDKLE